MSASYFLRWLGTTTLCTVLFNGTLLALIPDARAHYGMAVGTLCFFILLSSGLYVAGTRAAKSSNRQAFNNLIAGSVFGKMLVCMAFLLLYKLRFAPENSWFVAIFLSAYLAYTIFEVWFMTRLAKS